MQVIELKGIDEKIYYEKLDNGLSVYMNRNEKVSNTYMSLSVKYGSIYNEFKIDGEEEYHVTNYGTAHFLEHIKFNENDKETAHSFFNSLGSSVNAFTTFDFTLYEVFATTEFEKNLEHLLDFVQSSYITDKIVEKEKNVIVEEVRMGDNNPTHNFYYGVNNCLYKNDKRRFKVTGEEDDVRNTTREELQLIYNTFYHPENMILCITGNFDIDETLNLIKENQAKKTFLEFKHPVRKYIEEPKEILSSYYEEVGNIEIPKVRISYKMKQDIFKDIDQRLLDIYLSIILRNNFGAISDIKEELMEKDLIVSLTYGKEIFDGIVTITLHIETKYPDKVIPMIKDRMEHLELTSKDLKRRIRCNIASLINDFDDIEYINTDIVDQIITYGKIYDNIYDMYKNLNMKDANRVLKCMDLSQCVVGVLKSNVEK